MPACDDRRPAEKALTLEGLARRRRPAEAAAILAADGAVLDALWAHATKDEFSWYQVWRVGDLVLWDNRAVMHRRDAFDPSSRRLMHRTQMKGDRPF